MARPPSGYYGMSFPGEGGRQGQSRRSNEPTQYSIPTTPRNTRSMPDANLDGALMNTLRTEAIAEVNKREENNPLKNLPTLLSGIGSFTRKKIVEGLNRGGVPVYENGIVVGVMVNGVYTGRPSSAPTEGDDPDPSPTPAAAKPEQAPAAAASSTTTRDLPDLPDAPTGPGTGDASDEVKKKSKMGRESTIATGPSGLLTQARTRRRSLMSGLIQ